MSAVGDDELSRLSSSANHLRGDSVFARAQPPYESTTRDSCKLHGDDEPDDPEVLYADDDMTNASIVPPEESELEVSNIVADFQAERTQLLALQNGDQLPAPLPFCHYRPRPLTSRKSGTDSVNSS
jgi:hypothetical protein